MKKPEFKKRAFFKIVFIASVFLLVSGAFLYFINFDNQSKTAGISFYHWKTVYDPGDVEKDALASSGVDRLYLRMFDVVLDANKEIVPIASAIFRQKPELPIIPVVFIDNEAMKKIGVQNASFFSEMILSRVMKMINGNALAAAKELQIDCDWSPSSREAFFLLLRGIKASLPKDWTLSVTLRLYQYRYPEKAGVPPADRVVLMAYNMGALRAMGDNNSIIDAKTAALYLQGDAYPLPMNVALPLFSWGVLFDEKNEYRGLARVIPENLPHPSGDDNDLWTRVGAMSWRSNKAQFISGYKITPGWILRVERTTESELRALTQTLAKQIETPDRVIFYHLDSDLLKDWPFDVLKSVAHHLD